MYIIDVTYRIEEYSLEFLQNFGVIEVNTESACEGTYPQAGKCKIINVKHGSLDSEKSMMGKWTIFASEIFHCSVTKVHLLMVMSLAFFPHGKSFGVNYDHTLSNAHKAMPFW